MTQWLTLGINALVVLGGLAGLYVKLDRRLTTMETRQAERDSTAAQREELYARRNQDAFESYCRDHCPRAVGSGNTNPRLRAYSGQIAPDEG